MKKCLLYSAHKDEGGGEHKYIFKEVKDNSFQTQRSRHKLLSTRNELVRLVIETDCGRLC